MFDNIKDVDSNGVDEKLRANLKGFNRDSLRILHPVFVDALRLLARRGRPERQDTLLLPLAWPTQSPAGADDDLATPSFYRGVTRGQHGFAGLHHPA